MKRRKVLREQAYRAYQLAGGLLIGNPSVKDEPMVEELLDLLSAMANGHEPPPVGPRRPLPVWRDPDAPTFVWRVFPGPTSTGHTTHTPWCGVCQGWHIPGNGPCTATYS